MITPSTEDDGTAIDYNTGMLLLVSTGIFATVSEAPDVSTAEVSIDPPWQEAQRKEYP